MAGKKRKKAAKKKRVSAKVAKKLQKLASDKKLDELRAEGWVDVEQYDAWGDEDDGFCVVFERKEGANPRAPSMREPASDR